MTPSLLMTVLLLPTIATPALNRPQTECQIAGVYSAVAPEPGTLALTTYGEAEEVTTLLVPLTLERGRYRVSVTREASNLYRSLEGVYFQTRYCYEYAYSQTAVVEISGAGLYSGGTIDFDP